MGNFLYACVQIAHNLGAVAVVGGPAIAWLLIRVSAEEGGASAMNETAQHRLALFTVLAWSAQVVSGAGFGATSYYLKNHLPEITGAALAALGIKVGCAIAGFFLALLYMRSGSHWSTCMRLVAWEILFALGLTALTAAAVLRWYG